MILLLSGQAVYFVTLFSVTDFWWLVKPQIFSVFFLFPKHHHPPSIQDKKHWYRKWPVVQEPMSEPNHEFGESLFCCFPEVLYTT